MLVLVSQFACRSIEGFEVSHSVVAHLFCAFKVDAAIQYIIRDGLDRDRCKYLARGTRPGHEVSRPLMIVPDGGDDLDTLKQKPLGRNLGEAPWAMAIPHALWARTLMLCKENKNV